MKIILDKEDLKGSYFNNYDCPIARRLKKMGNESVLGRAFGNVCEVKTLLSGVVRGIGSGWETPTKVQGYL